MIHPSQAGQESSAVGGGGGGGRQPGTREPSWHGTTLMAGFSVHNLFSFPPT